MGWDGMTHGGLTHLKWACIGHELRPLANGRDCRDHRVDYVGDERLRDSWFEQTRLGLLRRSSRRVRPLSWRHDHPAESVAADGGRGNAMHAKERLGDRIDAVVTFDRRCEQGHLALDAIRHLLVGRDAHLDQRRAHRIHTPVRRRCPEARLGTRVDGSVALGNIVDAARIGRLSDGCGDVEEKVPHAQSEHDRDEEFRLVSHRDEHQQVAERALQREDQSEDA